VDCYTFDIYWEENMKHYNLNRNAHYSRNKSSYKNQSYHHSYHHKHQTHPEHPVRDAIYATITCLGTLCFAMLWWGIYTGMWLPLAIGIASSALAFITVNISFFKAFKKQKR
jgi:hypothetical protein